MKKFILPCSFSFVLTVSICLNIIFISGCSTFKPVIIPGQPDECNDMYTTGKIIDSLTGVFDKDTRAVSGALTLYTLNYTDCKQARKELRKEKRWNECLKMIYGSELKPIKINYRKYSEFLECNRIRASP